VSAKQNTFEALMSAFYMNPSSEFLGEVDREREHWGVFHWGEKPKDMRVTVVLPPVEEVQVKVEWRNYKTDPRNPIKGEQTFTIKTYAAEEADLRAATEKVLLSVLECYLDVLEEEGIAGDISKLAPEVEETDDEGQ
jgi:hypothetical protein